MRPCTYFFYFRLLFLGLLLPTAPHAYSESAPRNFKMWLGAGIPEMQSYDQELIRAILECSTQEFGEYTLTIEPITSTHKRHARTFDKGDSIELTTAPLNQLVVDGLESLFQYVDQPVMFGALGYRQLIVKKERVQEFADLNSLDQLQKLSIAQVANWADVEVLRANGIEVPEIQQFENLFPMLDKRRFDAIAIGVTEVATTLDKLNTESDTKFAVVPDLVVFYPLALYIVLRSTSNEAFERISYGVSKSLESKKIDALFDEYHRETFEKLKTPALRIIRLENKLPSAKNAVQEPILLQ